MLGNEIAYWLFYARFATVHVSAAVMIFAAVTLLIWKLRLNVKQSMSLLLLAAGLHEAIFNPVWIIYFRDWTAFNNLQTLYFFKFITYFVFTAVGLRIFRVRLGYWLFFATYFAVWIMAGLMTSVPLPNGYGVVGAAGSYWEFGYNLIYAVTFSLAIQLR